MPPAFCEPSSIMMQMGKENLTLLRGALLGVLVFLAGWAAAQEGPVVVDPLTGVAMGGYDPVSYFDGTMPQPGNPAYAVQWQGVPWHFASQANRDAFSEAPAAYAPQFGGYDPMALARGYLSRGNPQISAIHGDALFLFYSVGNRAAFAASVAASLGRAGEAWDRLRPRPLPRVSLPESGSAG